MGSKFGFDKIIIKLTNKQNEIMDEVAKATVDYFVSEFDKERFDDKNWEALAPSTLEYKKRMGYGSKKLYNTGKLRNDLKNSLIYKGRMQIKLEVKTPYASYQQDGTKNIPARPFLGQTQKLTELQLKIIDKAFDDIFN